MDLNAASLWMVSGPSGAGKTAFCRRAATLARQAGWQVAGLLSPALFSSGIKTGIQVEDLRSGARRPLASATPGDPFVLQLGNWAFDPQALAWGTEALQASAPCDLFIVDELGPLEFNRGQGWVAALSLLCQPGYRLGLVVIRPDLQEVARRSLPITHVLELSDPLQAEQAAFDWWRQVGEHAHA
jgi:nucleoside-triphosphatase THEP1